MLFQSFPVRIRSSLEALTGGNRVINWKITGDPSCTTAIIYFVPVSCERYPPVSRPVPQNGGDPDVPTRFPLHVEQALEALFLDNSVCSWGVTSESNFTTVMLRFKPGCQQFDNGPLGSPTGPGVRYSGRQIRFYEQERSKKERGIERNAIRLEDAEETMEGGEGEDAQAAAAKAGATQEQQVLRDDDNFIQNVSQFFNEPEISDVVLKVGDKKYHGHKFVLAKSSEVFRTMLYDKRWQQAGLPEIDLEESEECRKHFEPFLKFLYTAEVQICTESAVGILCLADKYSVMSLKTLCTQYMVSNTQSPKVRNALNWYSWAKALHMGELIDSCTKTISWNMEQLVSLPEWLDMDIDFVADILSNPQLVVANEHLLFGAVERWLLHDNHRHQLEAYAKKLLPLVRFPQMMVQELYKVETGDLSCQDDSKDLIEKLLNKAYRFRSLCPFQTDLNITFNEEFYRPRNYKDLTVDTVRMQNTLRFGIQVDVRTYVGPVPSTLREGEWKITYRKTNDSWTLQVYCHDSAMVNGEARIQAVLVISDDDDRVLQVEASEETVCSRGNHLTMVITLPGSSEAKLMTVLIKPLPI